MNNAYIKNLLSINKKAFQFLHDVEALTLKNRILSHSSPGNLPQTQLKRQ